MPGPFVFRAISTEDVMRLQTHAFFFIGCVVLVTACHRHQPADGGSSLRNVITQEQIDSSHASNIYDVITRLRGEFLRDRGRISIRTNQHERAVVFLNDQEYGIPETMRNIPVGRISEIRYFSGTEAVAKFGSQYGGGVIQLISRTQ
jgi:outer membrane cobalamin receptor